MRIFFKGPFFKKTLANWIDEVQKTLNNIIKSPILNKERHHYKHHKQHLKKE